MEFCPRCGAAAQNGFCEACGAPVAFPPVPALPQMPQPSRNGSFSFSTADPVAEAAGFYESELRKAGMTVARRDSSAGASLDGVTLTARDAARNRSVTVAAKRKDSGTSITITTGNQ